MFSPRGKKEARSLLLWWFERHNSQSNNRQRPIRIYAANGGLMIASRLRFFLDGNEVPAAELPMLENALASLVCETSQLEETAVAR